MTTHDDALVALYVRLLRAWNQRDATAMANCFTDDGLMIGFDGSLVEGRAAVQSHLTTIFRDHPTASFVTIVRRVQYLGDTGQIYADVGMVPQGGEVLNPETNARQTLTAVRTEEEWLVRLFQNTPVALHWDEAGRAALTTELQGAFTERGPLPQHHEPGR